MVVRWYPGAQEEYFSQGKVIFLIFPSVKCLFPVENSHFGTPKTNFSGFDKWKAKSKKQKKKKKKKKINPFSIFLFPYLSFTGRSAEISR